MSAQPAVAPTRTEASPDRAGPAARLGAVAFALTGAAFLIYPAARPWTDESTMAGAAAFASTQWIVAHLSAVIGFILLGLGVLAVREVLRDTPGARPAAVALLLTWVGVGLTVLYFGAEIFGLHAIGLRAVGHHDPSILAMTDTIRYNPAALTAFGAGLIILAAGAIMTAVAVGRSGLLPRWSAALVAVGLALFLPQFFAVPAVRIGHGALIAVGCGLLAVAMWRTRAR